MAVNEVLMVGRELDRPLDRVVVDGLLPEPLRRGDVAALRGAQDDPAVASALWLRRRARAQRAQAARLRAALPGVPASGLPFVFAAALGRRELEHLSAPLEELVA